MEEEEGNIMKSYIEIKNLSDDEAEVWIYDVIGQDFWGEGVAAKTFVKELTDIKASQINLHINSPGGSVFDGQAIYNAIARHPANVTTFIDGIAASIASVIALAGDEVIMAENALMMIHEPFAIVMGNANDMRDGANMLDKVSETIKAVYSSKTNLSDKKISDAMAAETWFTADEALDAGLATEISKEIRVAALLITDEMKARYKNVPESVGKPTFPMDKISDDAELITTNTFPGRFVRAVVTDSGTIFESTDNLKDFEDSSGADDKGDGASLNEEKTETEKEYDLLKAKKGI